MLPAGDSTISRLPGAGPGTATTEEEGFVWRELSMKTVKIVVWEEEDSWVGYLQDYPDYWTQGESLDDLKEHLKDLYSDLSAGLIPSPRRVEDLVIS